MMLIHAFLLISFVWMQEVLSLASAAVGDPVSAGPGVAERRLSAAKRSDKLGRRNVKGCLRHDHELHYLDGE